MNYYCHIFPFPASTEFKSDCTAWCVVVFQPTTPFSQLYIWDIMHWNIARYQQMLGRAMFFGSKSSDIHRQNSHTESTLPHSFKQPHSLVCGCFPTYIPFLTNGTSCHEQMFGRSMFFGSKREKKYLQHLLSQSCQPIHHVEVCKTIYEAQLS